MNIICSHNVLYSLFVPAGNTNHFHSINTHPPSHHSLYGLERKRGLADDPELDLPPEVPRGRYEAGDEDRGVIVHRGPLEGGREGQYQ